MANGSPIEFGRHHGNLRTSAASVIPPAQLATPAAAASGQQLPAIPRDTISVEVGLSHYALLMPILSCQYSSNCQKFTVSYMWSQKMSLCDYVRDMIVRDLI